MRDALVLLDAFILILAFVCSGTGAQDAAIRPSLVHLLRSKRFDFSMFGCSDCRPVMECHSDHECVIRKGRGYSCQFKCCSFSCGMRSSGYRYDYARDNGNYDKQYEDDQGTPTDILEDNSQVKLNILDKTNTTTPYHTSTDLTDQGSDVTDQGSDVTDQRSDVADQGSDVTDLGSDVTEQGPVVLKNEGDANL